MSLSKLLKTSDSIAVERMQLLVRHVPPVVLNAWIENMYNLNLVNKLLLDEASNPLKDAIFNEAFPLNNPWNRKRRGPDLADSRRKRNRGYAYGTRVFHDDVGICVFVNIYCSSSYR